MKKIISIILPLVLLLGLMVVPVSGAEEENEPGIPTESPLDIDIYVDNQLSSLVAGETLRLQFVMTNNTDKDYDHIWMGLGVFEEKSEGMNRLAELLPVENEDYTITENGTYFATFKSGQKSIVEYIYEIPEVWAGKNITLLGANFQTINDKVISGDFSNYVFEKILLWEPCYVTPFKTEVSWENDLAALHVGETLEVTYKITNLTDVEQKNVWAGLGLFDAGDYGLERIAEILACEDEDYKVTENGAYFASLGAHETVEVVFKCEIPSDLGGLEELLFGAVFQTTGDKAVFEEYISEKIVIMDIVFILPEDNPFADVPDGEYYYNPVLWAFSKKVTTGTSATEFSPDQKCTRAQIVTFLWRAMGEPEPKSTENPFTDVNMDEYYAPAVLWAVENGITNGTGAGVFSPDKECTRGQVVTFLWRAMESPEPESTDNPFQDVKTKEYYEKAVLWAVENGITTGTSVTTFEPESTCTRGQVVTFLYRSKDVEIPGNVF